jgi:hypothetical protein
MPVQAIVGFILMLAAVLAIMLWGVFTERRR